MNTLIFTIAFLIVLGIGSLVLQIFVSRKENRWLGLVLPILAFIISLIFALNVVYVGDMISTIMTVLSVLLWANIPTAVFLVIYFACREKYSQRRDLDKMKSQDL